MSYITSLTQAMGFLAQDSRTLFVGQSVRYPGQAMHKTFKCVPLNRRIEMPVAEDFQVGYCTGLSLEGYLPVCCLPRWDFLLLGANQLVNHLDKIPLMSGFRPKIIIRVAAGCTEPLNPGPQHTQNHTEAFRLMLKTIKVVQLQKSEDIMPAYVQALLNENSTILVEHMELYK